MKPAAWIGNRAKRIGGIKAASPALAISTKRRQLSLRRRQPAPVARNRATRAPNSSLLPQPKKPLPWIRRREVHADKPFHRSRNEILTPQ